MCDVDWQRIYAATSEDNKPTSGFIINEILHDISYCKPRQIPVVAMYLADCVDGDHAHVKLKALLVIKALAYRVPPFCECMQERLATLEKAANFTGETSALYGDEPFRLVRQAAQDALKALTCGESYHEQHKEMSSRIVGFGNYLPGEDTLLADGSVNVGITFRHVLAHTANRVQAGVWSFLEGVTEILTAPIGKNAVVIDGLELDMSEEPGEVDSTAAPSSGAINHLVGDLAAGGSPLSLNELEDTDDVNDLDIENYVSSAGEYVPPPVPPLRTDAAALSTAGGSASLPQPSDLAYRDTADENLVLSEAAILRTLGLEPTSNVVGEVANVLPLPHERRDDIELVKEDSGKRLAAVDCIRGRGRGRGRGRSWRGNVGGVTHDCSGVHVEAVNRVANMSEYVDLLDEGPGAGDSNAAADVSGRSTNSQEGDHCGGLVACEVVAPLVDLDVNRGSTLAFPFVDASVVQLPANGSHIAYP
eukprot:TRINITY_DN74085_c0_g1_i1.p1 TRINITY_DN74085_c0_g1~~TRINITY_DN74085_c0_g1_i1.p1  ORF type:complete len:477 (-),score=76.57 TRINITY_DN74085_c0_g1_i1:65-1495(-)